MRQFHCCATCKYWESSQSDRQIDDEAECAAIRAFGVRTWPRSGAPIITPADFWCRHYERLWSIADTGGVEEYRVDAERG
jgi:hypothetical protein